MSQTATNGRAITPAPGNWDDKCNFFTASDGSLWGSRRVIETHLPTQVEADGAPYRMSRVRLLKFGQIVRSHDAEKIPKRIRKMDVPCSTPNCTHCFIWHLGDATDVNVLCDEQIRAQEESAKAARQAAPDADS